jgi:hypothetical protein
MNQLTATKLPLISVLLPVYNAAPYLSESIKSILVQTYEHLELVVIDDGSTDESWRLLNEFAQQDKRIRLYQNEKNKGLIQTLNDSLSLCQGKYIARMDADDIAHPKRLQKQYEALQKNANCRFCGTAYCFFLKRRSRVQEQLQRLEFQQKYLHPRALFYTPLAHACLFVEASFYQSFQYSEAHPIAEDYELLTRMLQQSNALNVLQPLLSVRLSTTSVSVQYKQTQLESIQKIYQSQFDYYQIPYRQQDLATQLLISDSNNQLLTMDELNQINDWLQRLESIVVNQAIFDQQLFREVLSIVWYKCCQRATVAGLRLKKLYYQSPYAASIISPFLRRTLFVKSTAKQLLRRLDLR